MHKMVRIHFTLQLGKSHLEFSKVEVAILGVSLPVKWSLITQIFMSGPEI